PATSSPRSSSSRSWSSRGSRSRNVSDDDPRGRARPMNYAPRSLGRGSWLSRRDPRVLVIAIVCFVFTIVQVWDGRIVALLLALAFAYYRSAGIPFAAVRRNWAFVIVFVSFLVLVNTIITGGQVPGVPTDELVVYFTMPLLGTPISAQSVAYAITQLMRFLAMVTVGF